LLRIGVDVGGTNTDAVLLRGNSLVGSIKAATTADVERGVCDAIRGLLAEHGLDCSAIEAVMIGTTQFTNAFVERRRLSRVGMIRIGAPATTGIPPLYDWPASLQAAIGPHRVIVSGGYDFDGTALAALDEQAVAAAARDFRDHGIEAVAISCCFAPVCAQMEQRAAEIVRDTIADARISMSSDFGRLGLIERENATAMNASLSHLAESVIGSFRQAIRALGITAPFFISQNDGTIMTADEVERQPVLTFASGPTNSMRGAGFLAGIGDAIVVDIGGTTVDVGQLVHGLPRESAVAVDIGGVRTNFRMPDLVSRGLGGGSIVDMGDAVRVGPHSVGFELGRKALIFGGDTLTATDIAVAAGAADIGDRARVAHLPAALVEAALDAIHRQVDEAIDQIRTSKADMPVILVGGGSILVSRPLRSAPDVHRPDNHAVANAVGAATAQVGGEVDSIFSYETEGRDAVMAAAKALARSRAVEAGARGDSVRVVDVEEVPLAYLPGKSVHVRVKAIGDLAVAVHR
jgi:N-methylhydantoinase A/oxoprolinase/acetone carboxylase beta subunit